MSAYSKGSNKSKRLADVGNFWQDPDVNFNQFYASPDPQTFIYDNRLGYYYDNATGFYYDSETEYYYDPETKQWLCWSNLEGNYKPVESADEQMETSQEAQTSKKVEPSKVIHEKISEGLETNPKQLIKASELLEIAQQMYNTWKEQQKFLTSNVMPNLPIAQQKILKSFDVRMEILAEIFEEEPGASFVEDVAVASASKRKLPSLLDAVSQKKGASTLFDQITKKVREDVQSYGFFNQPVDIRPGIYAAQHQTTKQIKTPSAAVLGTRPRPLLGAYGYGSPCETEEASAKSGLLGAKPRPLIGGAYGSSGLDTVTGGMQARPLMGAGYRSTVFNGPVPTKRGNTTLITVPVKGGKMETFLPSTQEEINKQMEEEKRKQQEEKIRQEQEMREEIDRELTGDDILSLAFKKHVPNGDTELCLKLLKMHCKRCLDFGHIVGNCPNEAEPDKEIRIAKVKHISKLMKLYKRKVALAEEDKMRAQAEEAAVDASKSA